MPVHVVQVTAERAFNDHSSVALGYGSRFAGWSQVQLGAQGRFYPVGTFRSGLLVGGEYLFGTSRGTVSEGNLGETATGVLTNRIGGFVGGKYTLRVGFTGEMRAGVAYASSTTRAHKGDEFTAATSIGRMVPTLDACLGWSF